MEIVIAIVINTNLKGGNIKNTIKKIWDHLCLQRTMNGKFALTIQPIEKSNTTSIVLSF
jgi:hypothetical protein